MQPEYIKIPLTKGYEAIVDAEDADKVLPYRWNAHISRRKDGVCVYAQRQLTLPDGKRKSVYMHRVVSDAPSGVEVDHINRDGTDNRKSNLRLATHRENSRNKRRPVKSKTSAFHGVSWMKRDSKWIAQISWEGGYVWIGRFDVEADAAIAYDRKAKELHGEFATLNFPEWSKENEYREEDEGNV